MINITNAKIEKIATNTEVYKRGLNYYKERRIFNFDLCEDGLCARAIVWGSRRYQVEVYLSETGKITEMHCECEAYKQYHGGCKHIVALLKAYQGASKSIIEAREQLVTDMLESFAARSDFIEEKELILEVTLDIHDEWEYSTRIPTPSITLRMGEDKLYVVKNIKSLYEAMDNRETVVFGKKFEFDPTVHIFQPGDKPVISLLREVYEIEKTMQRDSWDYSQKSHRSMFRGKCAIITWSMVGRLLSLLEDKSFNLKIRDDLYPDVKIIEKDLPLNFILDKDKSNMVLKWKKIDIKPVVPTGEYIFFNGVIHKISQSQRLNFAPIFSALKNHPGGISLTKPQMEQFVTEALPIVKQIAEVEISPTLKDILYETEFKAEIHLDRKGDSITAKVMYLYGEIKINPFASTSKLSSGNKILIRDVIHEKAILTLFEQAEFRNLNSLLYLDDQEKIYEFVYNILPKAQQLAEVFYSEDFKTIKIRNSASLKSRVRLNEDNQLLELSFSLEDIDTSEIYNVINSLQEKKKYYRLKDGSFLPLDVPDSDLQQLQNIVDMLDISPGDLEQEVIELPKFRALYIDNCLRESKIDAERNLVFKQLVQNITEPQDMDFEIPKDINAKLRNYQKTGFKWLKTLAMYNFGGILADDMGLGKTIQTLAFIVSEKERVKGPSLVIAPTSVVYNWQDEAKKFAPGMKVVVVSGTPNEREAQLEEGKEADLIVTSYALIRRDIELYKNIRFGYCFLDEAQNIKNYNTQNAKAVKSIQARGRFALTGTPIENSLSELWSIFDFILPGYLLSQKKFSLKYETPIVKNQDKQTLNKLQKQIAPFIMRRIKKDVLPELPDKIENRVLTELTPDQKKIYLGYLQKAKKEIAEALATTGFERSQIKILAALTRLRQICCHPGTFLENYKGDSGKLQYLKEYVSDAIKGGHRILLFSQFVSMLGIIREIFNQEKIQYFYLDGSTKSEDRINMVRDFNTGKRDAFLISLKAGGTGLNLTGADMVIHYDPWWNPAVEDQATDRAYRIGQKNSVQVINLLTKGTIEEKIFELQQRKKLMINSVITPGETMLSKMTEEELKELFNVG